MVTFPKHESYKDSGVTWIGDIPTNWLVKSIKYISLVNPSGDQARKDEQVTFLPMEAVFVNGQYDLSRVDDRSAFPASLTEFKKEDVLLAKITPCFENGKGAFLEQLQTNKGIGSTEFHVFRVDQNQLNPKFLYYAIHNESFRAYAQVFMEGTAGQKRITTPFISNNKIPVPSIKEQERIVEFLDRKTAEIDQAIAQKQRLIELLQEQKAILINQAVTKGLKSNAPMRHSGVDWIGEIPEHWEIWRSKRLFSQRKEFAQSDDIQLSATQAYGVIPQEEYEDRIGRKVTKIFQHLEKRRHVEFGDFVISMRSFQGGLERAWARGCIRSSYVVLKPSEQVDVDFFSYVFKSSAYIIALQRTANFIRDGQDLNFDNFCAVDLVLPPIEEQQAIAQALNVAVSNNSKVTERTQKEIDLLQEFRQIFIANAVTGKIKV
jgi:type I restriction enzyme, S subunit